LSSLRWAFRAVAVAAFCAGVPAVAQRVTLEVRPRPGDTLVVTLNHTVSITGGPKNFPDSATTISTNYYIATRDIVERADETGTVILAIVDSVRMRTTGSFGASPFPGVDRGMERMRLRLRVMQDGSSQLIEGMSQLDPALRDVLGEMPSVLPLVSVNVGESWTRALPLPADGPPGATAGPPGTLRTTFRLDSLSHNGDRAWISLRGRVESASQPAREGTTLGSKMTGTLTGTLILDRRRGWLAESRATVVIESQVATPGGPPLLVTVRVHQVMQTAERRR
jgi:hypothetical protein